MTKYRQNTKKIAKKSGKTNIYKTKFSNNIRLFKKKISSSPKMDIE